MKLRPPGFPMAVAIFAELLWFALPSLPQGSPPSGCLQVRSSSGWDDATNKWQLVPVDVSSQADTVSPDVREQRDSFWKAPLPGASYSANKLWGISSGVVQPVTAQEIHRASEGKAVIVGMSVTELVNRLPSMLPAELRKHAQN